MKKFVSILMLSLLLMLVALPIVAMAEGDAPTVQPLTWAYLATITGASAFALLVVQLFKAPLDKVWKIPTRAFVYAICLIVMLLGTAFTTGLSGESAALAALNAVIATFAAMGEYEITFAKLNK